MKRKNRDEKGLHGEQCLANKKGKYSNDPILHITKYGKYSNDPILKITKNGKFSNDPILQITDKCANVLKNFSDNVGSISLESNRSDSSISKEILLKWLEKSIYVKIQAYCVTPTRMHCI